MNSICLTVVGRERPGIVAAITGVLLDNDCDIRDSTMSLLAGEFAMMLIVVLPPEMSGRSLERELFEVRRRFDLTVTTRDLVPDEVLAPPTSPAGRWSITIYGGDQKGIVHHVAALLARKGISIHALSTRVVGNIQGAGLVTIRVQAPPDVDRETVRRQLRDIAARFGVEVSVSGSAAK